MTSKEFDFYVKADLSKYEGKYIAIVGNKVVSSGHNAKEVLEKARKKFLDKNPTLAKIPKEEALIFKMKWNMRNELKELKNSSHEDILKFKLELEEKGWITLAEESLKEVWDNEKDAKVWQK
ncbi:hypothetical protein HYX00_03215 [Candidatus Woesearchaeota archaeon]|nr:hypothetical protein [Candidatus Woesearchaeota archaeon]